MRILVVIAFCLLALMAAACGSSPASQLSAVAPTPTVSVPETSLVSLPKLPEPGFFNPSRAAAAALVRINGGDANTAQNHSIVGNSLELNPPPGQPAFGLYQFNGAPGESIEGIEYEVSGLDSGEEVWIAIGDYSTGRWTFFAPQTTGVGTLNVSTTPGQFCSSGGDIWVLVVAFGDSFTLDRIGVAYADRWVVTGQVLDENGVGIPDVLVATPFGSIRTTTDAAGNYVMPGLPDGSWPLVATRSGFTFYSNPQLATVAGADLSGIDFVGNENGANFEPGDDDPAFGSLRVPQPISLATPYAGSLSAIDDNQDVFSVEINTPGSYLLTFSNPSHTIYFPSLNLLNANGSYILGQSAVMLGAASLPLTVVNTPTTFILDIGLSGGGGAYSLSLNPGTPQMIEGFVDELGNGLDEVLVTAVNTVSGEDSIYLSSGGFSSGAFNDPYRPAVQTTVSANLPFFTFAPPVRNVDLALGPDNAVNFTGIESARADSFEPNSDKITADANAVLSLPYDSTAGPDPLLAGFGDSMDWYRFTPAAGEAVRIAVSIDGPNNGVPFLFDVFEEDGITGVPYTSFYGRGNQEIRLNLLADGGDYYVAISPIFSVRHDHNYSLQIESFPPFELTSTLTFDGTPVESERFQVYLSNFDVRTDLFTDAVGKTPVVYLADGEAAYLELFRYGFDLHRTTKQVVINGADVDTLFAADSSKGLDSLEPNDAFFAPIATAFPGVVDATLSSNDDFQDGYQLAVTGGDALGVTLTACSSSAPIYVELYDSVFNFIGGTEVGLNLPPAVLPFTSGPGDYTLQCYANGSDIQYSLDLSQEQAYEISGSVTLGGVGVAGSLVHCVEMNRTAFPDLNGDYSLGLFSPGVYTLQAWAPGHTVNEGTSLPVVVIAGAVTTNFTLTADPPDLVDEPNDSIAQAVACTTDGSVSSPRTVGLGADFSDYYTFNANAGQLLEVRIDWGTHWTPNAFFSVYDGVGNYLGGDFPNNQTGAFATLTLPATDTYYIEVFGGPTTYTYKVTVN